MTNISLLILMFILQGDLTGYIQKKGRLSPSKVLRFSLDIARQVIIFSDYAAGDLCEQIFGKSFTSFFNIYYPYMVIDFQKAHLILP